MTILNLTLSTGPLIIPCVFLIGGYLLASFFLLGMGFIAMVASGFCVETLSISNALKTLKSEPCKEVITDCDKVQPLGSLDQTLTVKRFQLNELFEMSQ